jgi:hypothetical protein
MLAIQYILFIYLFQRFVNRKLMHRTTSAALPEGIQINK